MNMRLTVISVLLAMPLAAFAQQPRRTIAITIDDLPVVSTRKDLKNRQEITRKLLGHITKAKVPAIGFVNENKLYDGDKRDEKQVDLLRMWLTAGLELGNHTYSHKSLNSIALADYEADFLKGEAITKELLAAKGRPIRFFRHPFLQTGRTLPIKADFDAFLKQHSYTIAPVTIDNGDYIFSKAYDIVFDKGDKKLMERVGAAYVPYMESKLAYWERQSVMLFGRELSQTLLIHANFINSDYLDDLIAMFKRRGYRCIDLETALKDEAYRLPDTYIGPAGISWLHRWALARGQEYIVPDEPRVPDFVLSFPGSIRNKLSAHFAIDHPPEVEGVFFF
jgi:peptidoglycan/xylan/chitin deacetylase (PgdA/CDA1 family)